MIESLQSNLCGLIQVITARVGVVAIDKEKASKIVQLIIMSFQQH